MHPASTASTRLRATQYIPYLQDAGFEVEVWTFLSDADVPRWVGGNAVSRLIAVLAGLRRLLRLVRLLRWTRVVLVQKEVFPLGPPVIERLIARSDRQMIWDVDDAVWVHPPERSGFLRVFRAPEGKFAEIASLADEVWAGSDYLATWCSEHNEVVRVIPTTVAVPDQVPHRPAGRVVAWVGSQTTGVFLEAILPALMDVQPTPHVVSVGSDVAPPEGLDMEVLAWRPDTQRRVLREARVGLYPIDTRHPLAEGKCGFKAILYMAYGIPPVVTPTTTNKTIVRDGVDGFYAETLQEWTQRVQRLLDDRDLCERLGRTAHARARDRFSLELWGPRLASLLISMVKVPQS